MNKRFPWNPRRFPAGAGSLLIVAALATALFGSGLAARAETTPAAAEAPSGIDALPAERPAVGPEMNEYYRGADFDRWLGTFESSGREVYDRRQDVLAALDVQEGMRVADIGAGTGLYTMLFAGEVGPLGRVYAVDISESFIDAIAQRAAAAGLDNVETIVNHQKGTRLPPDSIDLAFLADTYHHFEYPRSMLASIHQALVPGGELAIIDFRRVPGVSNPWILGHVRAGREQVIDEVQAAGFRYVDEPLKLGGNYFLRFRKPAS